MASRVGLDDGPVVAIVGKFADVAVGVDRFPKCARFAGGVVNVVESIAEGVHTHDESTVGVKELPRHAAVFVNRPDDVGRRIDHVEMGVI